MIVSVLVALLGLLFVQSQFVNADGATYTNPILDGIGADPWVLSMLT